MRAARRVGVRGDGRDGRAHGGRVGVRVDMHEGREEAGGWGGGCMPNFGHGPKRDGG